MDKVRIVNDGSGKPFDTKITDVETGEELRNVFRAELTFDVNEAPKAILHMWLPVVNVTLDAEMIHYCPYCRRAMDEPTEDTQRQ